MKERNTLFLVDLFLRMNYYFKAARFKPNLNLAA